MTKEKKNENNALKQKLEASLKWPIDSLMCLSRLLCKPIIKTPAFFLFMKVFGPGAFDRK